MTSGIVIGKFLPVHRGHVALIEFAANQCDELIVSMSYHEDDVMGAERRFHWIEEIFKGHANIKPFKIPDDVDDAALPLHH